MRRKFKAYRILLKAAPTLSFLPGKRNHATTIAARKTNAKTICERAELSVNELPLKFTGNVHIPSIFLYRDCRVAGLERARNERINRRDRGQ